MSTPTHHIGVDQEGKYIAWTKDPTLRFPQFRRRATTTGWERALWVTPSSPAYWVANDTMPTSTAPAHGEEVKFFADDVLHYKAAIQGANIKTTKEYIKYIDTLGVLATMQFTF